MNRSRKATVLKRQAPHMRHGFELVLAVPDLAQLDAVQLTERPTEQQNLSSTFCLDETR